MSAERPVRVCRCGRVIGRDRAANARQCIDCASGKPPVTKRRRGAFTWMNGQHRTVNV